MADYSKLDSWSLKAQKEGYPARSVYKLQEIQEKFRVFKQGDKILDFGAAPGSWSLYVLRILKGSGFVAGVDLQSIDIVPPFPNCRFIKGDLYDTAVQTELSTLGPFNLVMSDAAPATTGNRSVDQSRSLGLVEEVIDYAEKFLQPGGNLVLKIFQGGNERELMDRLKTLYADAKSFKPKACRKESFETYLIGMGKKQCFNS